jgi:hypothetical protein
MEDSARSDDVPQSARQEAPGQQRDAGAIDRTRAPHVLAHRSHWYVPARYDGTLFQNLEVKTMFAMPVSHCSDYQYFTKNLAFNGLQRQHRLVVHQPPASEVRQ